MDEFTIWTIVFIVVVGGLNYLLRGYADKSGNSSSTDKYEPIKVISPPTEIYNWQTDLSKSDQIGNMYHNNNNH